MYLNLLKENEKNLFINLAYNLASADGNYSEDEKNLVYGYCQEMNIIFDKSSNINDTDSVVQEFVKNSDEQTKHIIIFELVGLAMVDCHYDEGERVFIKNIEDRFKVEIGYSEKCESVIAEYISFQEKINQLVIG